MPAVFVALDTGRICQSKAWVFADMCVDLTAEQAEVLFSRLLPVAERLTTGELAARIKRLAIALDPEWAARRYATAACERNVIGYLDPDGTATVTGSGRPVEQAASACARVEQLARAAKRAGHPGRIGPLRADIYLGLLDGRGQHHTRDQISTDLLTSAGHEARANAAASGDLDDTTATDHTSAAAAAAGTRAGADYSHAAEGPGAPQPAQRAGVEVRVGLSTLLGMVWQPPAPNTPAAMPRRL